MSDTKELTRHYSRSDLLGAIKRGLEALGKKRETATLDDLALVDEFHVGGRQASIELLDQMDVSADQFVLDIGCGLGGPARFAADYYGCKVAGVDLTEDYVTAGRVLCNWVGLSDKVSLRQGSALNMPLVDGTFDAAYMMHVGMNIADKAALCSEVYRLLRPGARFGIYDVMRVGEGELTFPVPWSSVPETSFVARPQEYKDALAAAGFKIVAERNRRDFALDFFEKQRVRLAASDGLPPLSLHIVMGENTGEKLQNLVTNIAENRVAPVEVIARKIA
ncbi:class I SAM-dependent methyltransferase [Pelagibius sp. Alg239-R121]|uniref:class I SAM-dependent methyltransferase n=1 Tax=Pelagibius sp. Alg239-R121 TaxID=2993448 RepID=UPI0024A6C7BE|nr:methyltransferase domain-containing protein [Pelagibius sp. Alg239-R121]